MISVIVPIYKVEAQLPKCLNSLKHQSYEDLEIILVDDGSPDRCGEICDSFAAEDKRFRVLHKKNEGVARARNDGLRMATGDYIAFADSDDWYQRNAFLCLFTLLQKTGADYAVGGCREVYDMDGTLKVPHKKAAPVRETVRSSTEVLRHILIRGSAIWNRLFPRELLSGLSFPEGRINDDEVMALRVASRCEKIAFTSEITYNYRIREGSITTSSFSLRNLDVYDNAKENLSLIKKTRPALLPFARYKLVKACFYCLVNLRKMPDSPEKEDALKRLRSSSKKTKDEALS